MPTTERSPRGRLDATTAACLVSLVPQAAQERTADQANLVCPDHLASLAALHWRSALKCPHHHAGHAHQDHPAHPVHLEMPAALVQMANLAALARMVATDHPAQLDPTAHLVAQERTETRELPAQLPNLFHPPPEMLEPLASKVHPVQLVKTEPQAQTEAPAQPETGDHPAQLVHPATTELLETRDHLAQMVQRENRVFAPSTAPPMVVSSSKMEQGDKRFLHPTFPRFCYTDENPVVYLSIIAFIFIVLFNGQSPQPQSTTHNTAAAPVISFGAF